MTHILIPLDHDPFEVTRESIENLPDWVRKVANQLRPLGASFGRDWRFEHKDFLNPSYEANWGHYLVSYRGKIKVWPPEDVERYIKNPYEECARVVEGLKACGCNGEHGPCLADDPYDHAAQAIRQLEQKET